MSKHEKFAGLISKFQNATYVKSTHKLNHEKKKQQTTKTSTGKKNPNISLLLIVLPISSVDATVQ